MGPYQRHFAIPPEMINAEVVGDPKDPGKEFPFLVVTTGLQGLHGLQEGVLKQILGQLLMANQLVDGGKNTGFVAVH
jgi:hypothetical protein